MILLEVAKRGPKIPRICKRPGPASVPLASPLKTRSAQAEVIQTRDREDIQIYQETVARILELTNSPWSKVNAQSSKKT